MVVGVCSFANTGDCTSTPGGFARLNRSVLQWIKRVKVLSRRNLMIFVFFSSFKVNSWQHETEMTMVNITKKIAENLNETTSMFDEYT